MISVLGAGPHGQQIAALLPGAKLYDDLLPTFESIWQGAQDAPYVIGAAWPEVRRGMFELVGHLPAHNDGRVTFPGARIGHGTWLGHHVHVGFNAVVSHGCRVSDFSTICAGVVLGGEVFVGACVFVGAGAIVLHGGITIGDGAVIGAGAVVTRDVEAGAVVKGNPAK